MRINSLQAWLERLRWASRRRLTVAFIAAAPPAPGGGLLLLPAIPRYSKR